MMFGSTLCFQLRPIFIWMRLLTNKMSFWATVALQIVHGHKITAWAAGPVFFDDTVNSQRYLEMLRNDFLP